MRYFSDNHEVTIDANISKRGVEILENLGFKSEWTIETENKKAKERERLNAFLEKRKADSDALTAAALAE